MDDDLVPNPYDQDNAVGLFGNPLGEYPLQDITPTGTATATDATGTVATDVSRLTDQVLQEVLQPCDTDDLIAEMQQLAVKMVNDIVSHNGTVRRLDKPNKFGMTLDVTVPKSSLSYHRRRLGTVGLDGTLQEIIAEVARCRGSVIPFCTVFSLTCIAATAGKRYIIYPGDFFDYAQLFAFCVGNSSTGKSNALRWFREPMAAANSSAQKDFEKNLAAWKNAGCKGEKPILQRVALSDFSDEVLLTRASKCGETIYFLEAEGIKVFKSIGRYSNSTITIDHMISFWDNEEIGRDRVSDENCFYLLRPCMTLGVGVQPERLEVLRDNKEILTSGLAARILFSVERRDRRGTMEPVPNKYRAQWAAILARVEAGGSGNNAPTELKMEPLAGTIYRAASDLWYEKYDNHDDPRKQVLHGKLDVNVIRWAMCVALANGHTEITADDMLYSVDCMEYFQRCADEVFFGDSTEAKAYREPTTAIDRGDTLNRWRAEFKRPPLNDTDLAAALGVTPASLCQARKRRRDKATDGVTTDK